MNSYYQSSTKCTPSLYFNKKEEKMEIIGKYCPLDPHIFNKKLLLSLEIFNALNRRSLKINFALEHVNSSSSKCLFLFFRKLDQLYQRGKQIEVNWFHNETNPNMKYYGEDLSNFFAIDFNFINSEELYCQN